LVPRSSGSAHDTQIEQNGHDDSDHTPVDPARPPTARSKKTAYIRVVKARTRNPNSGQSNWPSNSGKKNPDEEIQSKTGRHVAQGGEESEYEKEGPFFSTTAH
jgi:hypothetical protein